MESIVVLELVVDAGADTVDVGIGVIESRQLCFNAEAYNSLFLLSIICLEHLISFDSVCIWLSSNKNNFIFSCKCFGAIN